MSRALLVCFTVLFTAAACPARSPKYATHAAWQAAQIAQAVALATIVGVARGKMFQSTLSDGRTTREHCPAVDSLSEPEVELLRHTCASRAQGAHDPFERCTYFCTTHCEVHRAGSDGGA